MRQEFPSKVKVAAFERCAGNCENCTAKLNVGKFRYDHVIPDWMGGPNTLDNCQVICMACDRIKTPKDQRDIAKSRRVRARHLGAKRRSPRAFKAWRRFNGEIVICPATRKGTGRPDVETESG